MKLKTYDNGLRVFLDKRDDLRSATVGVWVAGGSRYEKEENNGISHFVEHILFKGTDKRTGFEIAEGMDEIGASYNAYTTKEYTYFYTKALDYQIVRAADILFDLIRNPALREKDIETEKGVILEEIAMCEDDPSDKCFELCEENVLKNTPFALSILGTKETVSAMSRQAIADYMARLYVPGRIIIGISGNFCEDEMLEKVEEYFSSGEASAENYERTPLTFTPCIVTENKPIEQTHISMAFKGIGIEHEDLYPLQAMVFILGMGSSSMLGRRIREELGLVYGIDAFLIRFSDGGYIDISMSLVPSSQEKAIRETLSIVSSFCESVTERQVAIAKEKLAASFIMSREQPQSKFSSMGYNLLLLGKTVTDDEIIERVRAVTFEDVKRVAEKYLDISGMSFTAVGGVSEDAFYKKIIDEFIS